MAWQTKDKAELDTLNPASGLFSYIWYSLPQLLLEIAGLNLKAFWSFCREAYCSFNISLSYIQLKITLRFGHFCIPFITLCTKNGELTET